MSKTSKIQASLDKSPARIEAISNTLLLGLMTEYIGPDISKKVSKVILEILDQAATDIHAVLNEKQLHSWDEWMTEADKDAIAENAEMLWDGSITRNK